MIACSDYQYTHRSGKRSLRLGGKKNILAKYHNSLAYVLAYIISTIKPSPSHLSAGKASAQNHRLRLGFYTATAFSQLINARARVFIVYIRHEIKVEAQPRSFLTLNFVTFCVSSGEVKYYDNSLTLVQGMGVKGSIWLSGCVAYDCLVEHPVVEVTMTVGRDRKTIDRQETLLIRPDEYPFQVDGLLGLKREDKDHRFVNVSIKIGETASQNILSSKYTCRKS